MVRTRRAEDLNCGDGRLDSSPSPPSAASCTSCAAWNSEPQPLEEFPLQCTDEDHAAELRLMQLREKQETPAQTWLVPEGHQQVLSAKHRRFLVGWLLTACEAQHFALGTFALAVSLLDRFLQSTTVRQEDAWAVQLTAVACLSIAAKFEEVNLPYSVASFQVEAPWEPLFSAAHVMAMELAVLCAIDWRVQAGASAPEFLDRLLHVASVGREASGQLLHPQVVHAARNTAKSLIAAALHDERYMTVLPSCTAGAAMLLGINVHCDTATTRAAYACLSKHLPAGTLRDCMQQMRSQWQPSQPQPPLAAGPLAAVPPSEADSESASAVTAQLTPATVSTHQDALDNKPQTPQRGLRRSSRLQQCKAVRNAGCEAGIIKSPHIKAAIAPELSSSPSVRSSATAFPGGSGRLGDSPLQPSNKQRSQSVSWPSCP